MSQCMMVCNVTMCYGVGYWNAMCAAVYVRRPCALLSVVRILCMLVRFVIVK